MSISETHEQITTLDELFSERAITRKQYEQRRAPLMEALKRYYEGPADEVES